MLTQEEKLKAFLTAIDEYAEKQRTRILSELEASNRLAVENAEKATLESAYEIIDRRTTAVRMQVSQEIAAREAKARQELIIKRNAIEAEVFARAAEKLTEYTKTEEYCEHLKRSAEKAAKLLGSEGITEIFVCERDLCHKDCIAEAFGRECSVIEDPSIKIGGLRFENDESARAIDSTYDSALYAQRDEFARMSGLKVI